MEDKMSNNGSGKQKDWVLFPYDAKNEKYVDMLKAGIIDPKKVTRIALENAASVAGMILTTECAVVDIKEESPAPMPPMGGGGMPGMM